jgi:hypothetical protein
MKKAVFAALAVMLSSPVLAQEQQVYSPYPQPNFMQDVYGGQQQTQNTEPPPMYRIYPGREQYGERYGYIPHHPGDYRDAVDRGQWNAGEPYISPRAYPYY